MSNNTTLRGELEAIGIAPSATLYQNLTTAELIAEALHRHEGRLASTGALVAHTGKRTGRSPGDKFVVRYDERPSAQEIWWGKVNQPITPLVFERLWARVAAYLQKRDLFVLDAQIGADPHYSLPVRLVSEFAWHALFAYQLLRRDSTAAQPVWTVLAAPRFLADPQRDGTKSETAIMLDVEQRRILICGTEYAGEIKKSLFTVMNYLMPQQDVLPMHCSANIGVNGDVALFFGLSGTGKTTLSADPERHLIGDDEHGWSAAGVFNIEGGCYAKCINLSREQEPQIWDAIRYGAVAENVVIDPISGVADYHNDSLTENTRVAYPVEFIAGAELSGRGGHPATIFFLTADAFGVLPPIARLSPSQAGYYFLAGYTAKTAGTEVGISEPEATFSACFGQPFLPRSPEVYAELLGEKLRQHGTRVYLLNTGWTGGPYGEGQRIRLAYTRAMVHAALQGELEDQAMVTDPIFRLQVPTRISGVPDSVLRPHDTWADPQRYTAQARHLAALFIENFKRFPSISPEIIDSGPRLE